MKIQINKLIYLTVVITMVFLTGCSVTPEKLTKKQIADVIKYDKSLLYVGQESISGELSLSDVMARALTYNLEHRTQRMAKAVAQGQFEQAKYEMLPALSGSADLSSRNNVDGSVSTSLYSGDESDEPSTSQSQRSVIGDLSISWNILDFGVSYFQAKQEADRYLISDESRKKVLLSLLHQAQVIYWEAVTAQELQGAVQQGLRKSVRAISNIDKGIYEGIYPNLLQPLRQKRQLLKTASELETLNESLNEARVALANLINVPLEQLPHLKIPKSFDVPKISASIEELEFTALLNSTNLAEQIYSTRIERLEARKALLRLLPSIQVGYGFNYDNNEYLVHENWSEASIQVSWNLMGLLTIGQTLENSETRVKLIQQQRLAVTMAVITQLNISLQKYKTTQKKLSKAKVLKEIDQLILEYSSNSTATNSSSIIQEITNEVGSLRSRMEYLQSLSSAHEAYSSVWIALGLSPVPEHYQRLNLKSLSEHINKNLLNWNAGHLDVALIDKEGDKVENEEAL